MYIFVSFAASKTNTMDSNNVTIFMAQHGDKFPAVSMPIIKKKLDEADEQKFFFIGTQEYRSPVMIIIVSLLCGTLGIDRFLLGQTGLGIAKLLTCGGFGFWTIIDWFLVMNATRESNFEKFTRVAG